MLSIAKLVALAALLAPLNASAERIYARRRRNNDPQESLTLDPRVIQPSGELTGQEGGGDPGQVASLTTKNNFINFCLTQNVPLTDGQQKVGGSCNPIPMGRIAAKDKQPSCKFVFPPNNDESLKENQPFTLKLAINQLVTGFFANPTVKYYSAPQTVDEATGFIIGHSHVVIQKLDSLTTTTPADPTVFAFFKGLNEPATDGTLSADVLTGLPAGAYRICSINSSTNHQPTLVAVAQHGSLDDCSYFTVKPDQGGNGGNNNHGGDPEHKHGNDSNGVDHHNDKRDNNDQ